MPNWVFNTLTIKGDKSTLNNLSEFVRTDEHVFDFAKIVPENRTDYRTKVWKNPKQLHEEFAYSTDAMVSVDWIEKVTDSTETNSRGEIFAGWAHNWYDDHCDNWGTKWNACDPNRDETDDTLTYNFQTAWSAPLPIVKALAKKFPSLSFDFYCDEESNAFWIHGVSDSNGDIDFTEVGNDEMFTKARKLEAVRTALADRNLDPEQYDLQAIVDDSDTYIDVEFSDADNDFKNPRLYLVEEPSDFAEFKK